MATLTDGELFKKTLRTTLVMLGTTALWLGVLSGAIIVSTGASTSATPESKVEKAAAQAPGSPPAGAAPHGGAAIPSPRVHQSRPLKTEGPHPGDPI